MPDYIIRVIPKGSTITDHPFTGTKSDARAMAREIAREAFPQSTSMRWSDNATLVYARGTYAGTVAVEQAEKEST